MLWQIPAAESSEEGSAEAGATNPLAEGPAGEIMQMINSYTNHPLFQVSARVHGFRFRMTQRPCISV